MRRLKQEENRNAKSEVYSRNPVMEIPKFVLIVEDYSQIDQEDVDCNEASEGNEQKAPTEGDDNNLPTASSDQSNVETKEESSHQDSDENSQVEMDELISEAGAETIQD